MSVKTGGLKALLQSNEIEFLMEAHDGISSKIVENTGFKGIWASGLSIATSQGVRDSNEISWTQVLNVLEMMSDSTSIPILVDGDTGWGNFNNFRRFVNKLCQREISGVCIEDKLFPKTNSFVDKKQSLTSIDEFCGKIKAGKDTQSIDDFSIIARTEALIAGLGLKEALKRAEAYRKAGADGILIHSKKADGIEILKFAEEWGNRAPLVIVPTTYPNVSTDTFRQYQISLSIWANHNMRASIAAMQNISQQIFNAECLSGVDKKISPIKEIFNMLDYDELKSAENNYLPNK